MDFLLHRAREESHKHMSNKAHMRRMIGCGNRQSNNEGFDEPESAIPVIPPEELLAEVVRRLRDLRNMPVENVMEQAAVEDVRRSLVAEQRRLEEIIRRQREVHRLPKTGRGDRTPPRNVRPRNECTPPRRQRPRQLTVLEELGIRRAEYAGLAGDLRRSPRSQVELVARQELQEINRLIEEEEEKEEEEMRKALSGYYQITDTIHRHNFQPPPPPPPAVGTGYKKGYGDSSSVSSHSWFTKTYFDRHKRKPFFTGRHKKGKEREEARREHMEREMMGMEDKKGKGGRHSKVKPDEFMQLTPHTPPRTRAPSAHERRAFLENLKPSHAERRINARANLVHTKIRGMENLHERTQRRVDELMRNAEHQRQRENMLMGQEDYRR